MAVLRTLLSRYRASNGLSQEDVAHRAGLSLPTYRRLESFPQPGEAGRMPVPSLGTVVRVIRAIEAESDFLAALEAARADPSRGGGVLLGEVEPE